MSKEILTKLLATENVRVEHKKIPTAYFDLKNRIVNLPIWKDMTNELYNLLIAHEVSHALHTPEQGWHGAVCEKGATFKGFLNVIEDARIERMIKAKFPGIKRDFYKGYKELIEKDFFGIKDVDVNELNLIDRINIHTKLGTLSTIKFDEEEQVFVDACDELVTFDDVVDLATRIYEFMKEKQEDQESQTDRVTSFPQTGEEGDGEQMEMPQQEQGEEEDEGSESNETQDSEKKESEGDEAEAEDSGESEVGDGEEREVDQIPEQTTAGQEGGFGCDDPLRSKTDEAFRKSEEALVDEEAKEWRYVNLPNLPYAKYIVPYKEVLAELSKFYYSQQPTTMNMKRSNADLGVELLATFKRDNNRAVQYMAKEFEMKKRADEYKRTSTAKSGELDVNKLHSYKFNDDIFSRVAHVTGGKNHGLVMFLDWSGSICEHIYGMIEQTLNLALFCKKVNIPFHVYAFTDRSEGVPQEYKIGDLYLDRGVRLVEFLSSEMNKRDMDEACKLMLLVAKAFSEYRNWNSDVPPTPHSAYMLGGTPMNHAIVLAMDLVPDFKKAKGLQVVNTVFITDGDSHPCNDYIVNEFGKTRYLNDYLEQTVYVDPKTRKEYKGSARGWEQTKVLLDILRDRTRGEVIGFHIINKNRRNFSSVYRIRNGLKGHAHFDLIEAKRKEFMKEKAIIIRDKGFTENYIIAGGNDLHTANSSMENVETGAKKGAIKNAFLKANKGRETSRKILSSFIEKVA
jgi:hypothetical protein